MSEMLQNSPTSIFNSNIFPGMITLDPGPPLIRESEAEMKGEVASWLSGERRWTDDPALERGCRSSSVATTSQTIELPKSFCSHAELRSNMPTHRTHVNSFDVKSTAFS